MKKLQRSGTTRWRSAATDRGAGLAEFALVLPALLMILLGIIQLGLALMRAQAVDAAAHEAGRLASLSSTSTADVSNRVETTLRGTAVTVQPAVTVFPGTCAGRQGESVTVTVSVPDHITIPLVIDHDVLLTGRAVFRCEA